MSVVDSDYTAYRKRPIKWKYCDAVTDKKAKDAFVESSDVETYIKAYSINLDVQI